jgi:hypothetical protein
MPSVTVQRPKVGEYKPYYDTYISLVPDGDLLAQLERQARETVTLLRGVSEDQSQYRYAPGKWSIREVVGHLSDSERVFAYRALTFAREDPTALPSFDENTWAAKSNAGSRSLKDLAAEFVTVRQSTLALFRSFTNEHFARSGVASDHAISVRALAYIITGHERHHVKILHDRYGV